MFKYLTPDFRCDGIFDIPLETFIDRGKTILLLDLDNTLGPWGVTQLDPKALEFLKSLKRRDFSVGILSNSRLFGRKATLLNQLASLKIPLIYDARKPFKGGFERLLETLNASPQHAVMIGDQPFTDIWGAKRLGITTVLVEPYDRHSEPLWARSRRFIEKIFMLKEPEKI